MQVHGQSPSELLQRSIPVSCSSNSVFNCANLAAGHLTIIAFILSNHCWQDLDSWPFSRSRSVISFFKSGRRMILPEGRRTHLLANILSSASSMADKVVAKSPGASIWLKSVIIVLDLPNLNSSARICSDRVGTSTPGFSPGFSL